MRSTLWELEFLRSKIEGTSKPLSTENPVFVFGYLEENEWSREFVKELEVTQKEIQTSLLGSSNFLKDVLKRVLQEDYSVRQFENFRFYFDKEQHENIDWIMARNIWVSLQNYDRDSIDFFIEGLLGNPGKQKCVRDRCCSFPDYKQNVLNAVANLKNANAVFEALAKDETKHCVIPLRLYAKTLKEGNGRALGDETHVSLKYTIFDPQGE